MALVCDIKSESKPADENTDIEDGEITDDDEDPIEEPSNPSTAGSQTTIPVVPKPLGSQSDSDGTRDFSEPNSRDRSDERERVDDKDRFLDARGRGKNRDAKKRRDRTAKEEKGHRHMTEAEKSILHLRKREKMLREREKWEKQHSRPKEPDPLDDDFAKNIEKTLATILHKKEKERGEASISAGEESKDEEKRGKKRKNEDKDKMKSKQKRLNDSPRLSSEIDENEMLNVRSGSPGTDQRLPMRFEPPMVMEHHSRSGSHSGDSYVSEPASSDERDERARRSSNKSRRKKEMRRERRERKQQQRRAREEQVKNSLQDAQEVCVFYMQGKCQKNDCPYSHDVSMPMKLELCKFYLMDCCAKGDNCSYMHSEFPCKFYHTGLNCASGKECKFAHGRPLSEGLKQILFKHIETAPRDILQGFPRLSRDEALNHINQTQKKLQEQYNVEMGQQEESQNSEKGGLVLPSTFDVPVSMPAEVLKYDTSKNKSDRQKNKSSRWQQYEPNNQGPSTTFAQKSFGFDQDMRITSNGDIDMRTLPNLSSSKVESSGENGQNRDVDHRNFTQDVDIRQSPFVTPNMDVDIRTMPFDDLSRPPPTGQPVGEEAVATSNFDLPQTTRDLLARINANQKDNTVNVNLANKDTPTIQETSYDDQNINWYSDDDDDDENRLTIKVEDDEVQKKDRDEGENDALNSSHLSSPEINTKTADIVGRIGDLSKIDISAEVTKLLTSMSQNKGSSGEIESDEMSKTSPTESMNANTTALSDPRIAARQARQDPRLSDPRQRGRQNSVETKEKDRKSEKLSIYEQGGMDIKKAALEIEDEDFKASLRPDIDLRNMTLPFKGMQNYTPATEIDASLNSHLPLSWKVMVVDIPRPDYTGLKLSISDAEKTGDPRLKKIFRLSTEDKDSPASPKSSPKQGTRLDPRLRKIEEKVNENKDSLSYSQQLNLLQSSPFYLSLTSNQKLMLNQELARHDQSGGPGLHDPVLNNLLSNLNLLPQAQSSNPITHIGVAASILTF
ncbi:hypothetical protein ABEB36_006601 [Hypothenemus hampei]|uniref:C3H1-type domain-containing protein n=1 Tax=Hypothenemus hampei TaxID=57062 RepID=A0ABD1ER39_HYPHA